jgi:hypothetical protein
VVVLLSALMEGAPTHKDVVIAEVGAAAAFVGFVLVFLGVLITTHQSLVGQVRDEKLAKLESAGWVSLLVFLLGLASVVLSTAWLIVGGGHRFYDATLIVFFAELLALVAVAVFATQRVLRG